MKSLLFALVATLVFVSSPAMAGDAAAGKAKSAMCASCHGADGIGLTPLYPNLAGQKEAYLVKQMTGFRDGTRKDPLMSPMSMALTDEDIANLAAYYAGM